MSGNKELLSFLKKQKVLVISTIDEAGNPWVANVYFSVNDNLELFYVSSLNTKHAKNIKNNARVAFSTFWYEDSNLSNRVGVQGTGVCKRLNSPLATAKYLKNHYKYFPDWKEVINVKTMFEKIIESRPFIIQPDYIKFWNDELYGSEGVKEFNFGTGVEKANQGKE